MAKNKDGIKISFVGPAANGVTGSCIWIQTPERQILLECGLYQSCKSTLENYKINNKHFEFKPKDIDYLFVCHCHSDHLSLSPRLYAMNCEAPMIMPQGSYNIVEILLRDSANIIRADADELSLKFNRNYSPVYTSSNVDTCLKHYVEYPIGEIIKLDEFVKFRFISSGHILNSAQIELWITNGNITKKIVYTSDLGNVHIKKEYIDSFKRISKADILIGETTYASRDKIANMTMRKKDLEKLKAVIKQTCINDKSRVLIPVFANARCQEILTHLYNIFGTDSDFDIPILIDSPMAIKCCQSYTKDLSGENAEKWNNVLKWNNVHFVQDAIESKWWRDSHTPVIILASSGMLTKGRSVGWLYNMLPCSTDRIVFCGYAAEGSLASIIKEGKQKYINVFGKTRSNKCQITNLLSFSSHMQSDSLLKYYSSVQCEKVILVHGEMEPKIDFAKELQKEISKNNNTSKVIVANKGYKLVI